MIYLELEEQGGIPFSNELIFEEKNTVILLLVYLTKLTKVTIRSIFTELY